MTKNILLWVWGIVLTLGLIYVGLHAFAPQTFGDSTVSLLPTQYVNGINVGPVGAKQNTVYSVYSQSFTQNAVTLGSYTAATSTTSTIEQLTNVGHTQNGLTVAVGDTCIGGITTAATSTSFGIDVNIIGVNKTAQTASASVTYWNGSASAFTLATGTLAITCFNTPF